MKTNNLCRDLIARFLANFLPLIRSQNNYVKNLIFTELKEDNLVYQTKFLK